MLRSLFQATVFAVVSGLPAVAQELAQPTGDVILVVSGNVAQVNVAQVNAGATAQLDLQMLEAFEATTIETATIWTEGVQEFTGVSLATLVKELGLTGTTLRATAINDYTVEIPMTDAVEGGAIIAYRLNGDVMSVRDKGPLWVVYPYDSDAAYRTEVVYSKSIWQLDRIEVVD